MVDKKQQIREQAENNLYSFINLVHPNRVLGSCHFELTNWWDRQDKKSHQLVLMPRDHQKSAMVAYRVAQAITKNPAIRILYISATANLATKQLKFIKDILTCEKYRQYWPDMVHPEEAKREKWTEGEISVDHPLRKAEAVRDPTVFTAGLTTNIAGMHCDIAVLDDVVVDDTAYTEEGREKLRRQYSLLSSIEGADSLEWVVGTRYDPRDLYNDMLQMEIEGWEDEEGNILEAQKLYEVFERQVENEGDGTGQYLWPRQIRYDGKAFGFNEQILKRKYAQYLDKTQFYAQYYNNPNVSSNRAIDPEKFQYYDQKYLTKKDGYWYYKADKLNVFAAVDFAYSLAKRADYTAVVVVGVSSKMNYYVLEVDRFKTDQISEYFKHILILFQKWGFRKLRAEVTGAQKAIVADLKQNYIRKYGLALSIDDHLPTRHIGAKEERIEAALHSKYDNQQMWHYMGGNCQVLEEELIMKKPPHDDVKDALACCMDICVAPFGMNKTATNYFEPSLLAGRFGGMA